MLEHLVEACTELRNVNDRIAEFNRSVNARSNIAYYSALLLCFVSCMTLLYIGVPLELLHYFIIGAFFTTISVPSIAAYVTRALMTRDPVYRLKLGYLQEARQNVERRYPLAAQLYAALR